MKQAKGRQEINRFLRRFLVLVLIVLMAAASLAGYAAYYPVSFTLPTPVPGHQAQSNLFYWVLLKPDNFTGQTELGMDQVYLKDFADSVRAVFQYQLQSVQASLISYQYRIDATFRVHDSNQPDTVLLTKSVNLLPETAGEIQGNRLDLSHQIDLKLADYETWIADYRQQSSQPAVFDLYVTLSVETIARLPFGSYHSSGETALLIPLDQAQFTVSRVLPGPMPSVQLLPVTYRMVVSQLPIPVYPVMAAACFLLLVLLLTTTRSRRKNRYNRRLRRMLRLARNQLMIIGDKAWEPEWCVKAADFKSMVRTARKLKHPIFCYMDQTSPVRTAYFYIYYGENNYCYTFSDGSVRTDLAGPADESVLPDFFDSDQTANPAELDDRIPLLPESDDSPEILLANLRVQSSIL